MDMYVPRRSIRRDSDGLFFIALDGLEMASDFDSAYEARLEVDAACFAQAVGLELRSTQQEFTNKVLDLAMQVAHAFFRADEVRKSLAKGLDLLRQGPEDKRWFIDGQTIKVMPASGKSSKSYQVRETCTCKDVYIRAHLHGGMCKHMALRVLMILAQMGAGELNHLLDALDDAQQRVIASAEQEEEQDILALVVAALDAGDTARAEEIAANSGNDADGIREFIVMYQQCAVEAEAEAVTA